MNSVTIKQPEFTLVIGNDFGRLEPASGNSPVQAWHDFLTRMGGTPYSEATAISAAIEVMADVPGFADKLLFHADFQTWLLTEPETSKWGGERFNLTAGRLHMLSDNLQGYVEAGAGGTPARFHDNVVSRAWWTGTNATAKVCFAGHVLWVGSDAMLQDYVGSHYSVGGSDGIAEAEAGATVIDFYSKSAIGGLNIGNTWTDSDYDLQPWPHRRPRLPTRDWHDDSNVFLSFAGSN